MVIIIIIGLILLNGILSMSEIALVSARKTKLEAAAKRGDVNAQIALKTANSPNKFLSTVQIGITLIGVLTGIFSGESLTVPLQNYFEFTVHLKPNTSETLAVGIVVVILTFFSLVFGELIPKRIGLTNPEGISKAMARPMLLLSKVTAPFVWLLTITTDLFIKLFRIKHSADSKVTEEEIKAIIQESADGGEIQEIEQDIVERVFSLGDRNVASLMTHRNDISYIAIDNSPEEVRAIVNNEIHSLYPIHDNDKDRVLGMIQLKDLFAHLNDPEFTLKKYIRKPQFVSENTTAYEVLKIFKSSNVHYGFVVDEFGQMQGLVTMNDLLEALVGDTSDFYSDEFDFKEMEDGGWLVDGQYPMHDFLRKFDLEEIDFDHQFNTISGLVLHELKSIPVTMQKLEWMDFEITILDMDGARIDKVMVKRTEV